uniref:Paraneoplastic antigen Ma-like N-terminal domain-containing protein n=1 Tax=Castor canadensis TaxID=51338 RepID=A0A8C0X5Q3_CASCN
MNRHPVGSKMAVSLLQNWCRGLDVDEHRALLVTGIPEDLEPVDIEAILQPTLLPLGQFRLLAVSAMSQEKAKAALIHPAMLGPSCFPSPASSRTSCLLLFPVQVCPCPQPSVGSFNPTTFSALDARLKVCN